MDHDTPGEPATARPRGVGGAVTALVSYALFAVGIAALASFFAPYLGVPQLAWHTSALPVIAAPAEGDRLINVAPLLVGVLASSVGVWLR